MGEECRAARTRARCGQRMANAARVCSGLGRRGARARVRARVRVRACGAGAGAMRLECGGGREFDGDFGVGPDKLRERIYSENKDKQPESDVAEWLRRQPANVKNKLISAKKYD